MPFEVFHTPRSYICLYVNTHGLVIIILSTSWTHQEKGKKLVCDFADQGDILGVGMIFLKLHLELIKKYKEDNNYTYKYTSWLSRPSKVGDLANHINMH